eukprot:6203224-Pleurochrysis_carterae.AAC.1
MTQLRMAAWICCPHFRYTKTMATNPTRGTEVLALTVPARYLHLGTGTDAGRGSCTCACTPTERRTRREEEDGDRIGAGGRELAR